MTYAQQTDLEGGEADRSVSNSPLSCSSSCDESSPIPVMQPCSNATAASPNVEADRPASPGSFYRSRTVPSFVSSPSMPHASFETVVSNDHARRDGGVTARRAFVEVEPSKPNTNGIFAKFQALKNSNNRAIGRAFHSQAAVVATHQFSTVMAGRPRSPSPGPRYTHAGVGSQSFSALHRTNHRRFSGYSSCHSEDEALSPSMDEMFASSEERHRRGRIREERERSKGLSPLLSLQLLSDLHLEMSGHRSSASLRQITASAPYLGILGDLGQPHQPYYSDFLFRMADMFEQVFLILGNHELYGSSYSNARRRVAEICAKRPNLHLLDRNSYLVPGTNVRIIGATLWSHVPTEDAIRVEKSISDYRKIHIDEEDDEQLESDQKSDAPPADNHCNNNGCSCIPSNEEAETPLRNSGASGDREFRVEHSNTMHARDLQWIVEQIEICKQTNEKLVVLTHHAPTQRNTSSPLVLSSGMQCAFSTPLDDMIGDPILLWGFGHTHFSSDQSINGTRVVSNQYGYAVRGEKDTGFDPNFVAHVFDRNGQTDSESDAADPPAACSSSDEASDSDSSADRRRHYGSTSSDELAAAMSAAFDTPVSFDRETLV